MEYQFCVPCLLGLEGPIASELKHMKQEQVRSENGRVYFRGDAASLARANIRLRIGERVLVELGRFRATTFDELFEQTKALPWEQFLSADSEFPVKGYSLNSTLFSVSDCQKIIKKAVVEHLKTRYHLEWFPENGVRYQIQFSIMKDEVSMCLDTTGDGLHKRGYRPAHNAAPLKETLAAAMVSLAHYRGREEICDPFCGSGTIPIEAALTAKNRAPGLERSFQAMQWPQFPAEVWEEERELARSQEFRGEYRILGTDIDPKAIEIAREMPVVPEWMMWSNLKWRMFEPSPGTVRRGSSLRIRPTASGSWSEPRRRNFTVCSENGTGRAADGICSCCRLIRISSDSSDRMQIRNGNSITE